MRVLDVRPKGIYFTLEFSGEDLQKVIDWLDHASVEYNSTEEPLMIKADEYVKEVIYNGFRELLRNYKDGT